MDEHFRTAPLEKNMPVILALLGIWYNNFFGMHRHMRSCRTISTCIASRHTSSKETWKATGNLLTATGVGSITATGPVIWGEPGTNGQHAFYQLDSSGHEDHSGGLRCADRNA